MFNDSYASPMFNTPIVFTPNDKNGTIIVEQPENNDDKKDQDEKDIETEREVSQSFIDYMGNTMNYLKSYYYWK